MRLVENKKGVVRVIESILATMLLMSCLAMIPAQPNLKNSYTNLASMGQNALLSLDNNGHLAKLVDNRDWTELQASIESVLPITVWFNLTVFDQNMNIINGSPICNGGPTSSKIVSTDYVCASPSGTYAVYTLQLQLSSVGSS